jgi:DNA polymerase-3 subunit epsilon
MPEPDNPVDPDAIAVLIDGQLVGYLSRENAAAYGPGLRQLMKHSSEGFVALQATIAGGGQREDGPGRLGVFLRHNPADFGVTRESEPASPTSRDRDPIGLPPSLRARLAEHGLDDALGEGAPPASTIYLRRMLQALEDGVFSIGEVDELAALSREHGLSADDLEAAHRGLLAAIARHAIEDDVVSRSEREELRIVARLLDVPDTTVRQALADARERKAAALSQDLPPLPTDWEFGEPLRVGDRIAITGCEAFGRSALEEHTRARGVIVTGGVSRKTTLLVSDGTVDGTKARAARELGTRVVTPVTFQTLIDHVQPALTPSQPTPRSQARPVRPSTEGSADVIRIRQWARDNGMTVGERGRISQDVLDAYTRAHADIDRRSE